MFILRFKEWLILIKIITISIVSVTFITLVILLYFMPLVEQKKLDGKKEGLKNVVDVAFGIFQEYDSLEEVYQRIGEVFTQQLGIRCCFIYQFIHAKNAMQLTFPSSFDQEEMLCKQNILDNCDLYKAKRTGHAITSTTFSAICRQFTAQIGHRDPFRRRGVSGSVD
jgi:F0F1-type ATP synthase membrane subunit a